MATWRSSRVPSLPKEIGPSRRSPTAKSTSLKKRLLSRGVFDGGEGDLAVLRAVRMWSRARRSSAGLGLGVWGGRSRPAPEGPPVRGSLDGPVLCCRQPHAGGTGRRQAVLVDSVVVGLSGPHHC